MSEVSFAEITLTASQESTEVETLTPEEVLLYSEIESIVSDHLAYTDGQGASSKLLEHAVILLSEEHLEQVEKEMQALLYIISTEEAKEELLALPNVEARPQTKDFLPKDKHLEKPLQTTSYSEKSAQGAAQTQSKSSAKIVYPSLFSLVGSLAKEKTEARQAKVSEPRSTMISSQSNSNKTLAPMERSRAHFTAANLPNTLFNQENVAEKKYEERKQYQEEKEGFSDKKQQQEDEGKSDRQQQERENREPKHKKKRKVLSIQALNETKERSSHLNGGIERDRKPLEGPKKSQEPEKAPTKANETLHGIENIYIRFMALMARILGQAEAEAHQLYLRIKDRTDNIDLLTLLLSKINSENGKIDWSKDEEMKELIEKARSIGVEIPEEKYKWSEEEKKLLKENIQMRKDSMEKVTQLERTDMQRYLQEASQAHQARSNILKLMKEVIDTIIYNMRP